MILVFGAGEVKLTFLRQLTSHATLEPDVTWDAPWGIQVASEIKGISARFSAGQTLPGGMQNTIIYTIMTMFWGKMTERPLIG
jgi:hypothetical protein